MNIHPSDDLSTAVPPALIAERRAGWHEFTRFIVANCMAVAGLLIALFLIFKVF